MCDHAENELHLDASVFFDSSCRNGTSLPTLEHVFPMTIHVEPHPLLRPAAFTSHFATALGAATAAPESSEFIESQALSALAFGDGDYDATPRPSPPLSRDEAVRKAVRDMLRFGGYKPTGRGKPASEYLVRAAEDGSLAPINVAVDACNVVSLHSGFPISVVDAERSRPPFRIAVAEPGTRYVFNHAGQEIDLGGLVCLFDAEGACANAVKDSQRTKTHEHTTSTVSVIWGVAGHEDRLTRAVEWYRALLHDAGAITTLVYIQSAQ
jgi:DNA/RNA-binding domain of Phe-tRNA-synthetase-like protein